MDDLLKEAIADAKAVRETALENAKIALEEAFTPRLQSMLSKKIQSEIEVDEADTNQVWKYKAVGYSNLKISHRMAITDMKWLPKAVRLSKRDKEANDEEFTHLVTTSEDG